MENKKAKNVLLAVMGILVIVAIIARILRFSTNPVATIAYLISLVFTALYGFWFYKKPHGNMLKYAMLIVALATILSSSYGLITGKSYHIVKILASAVLCYCAGRLNRIDQNKYLLPIICLVFLGTSVYKMIGDISNQNIELTATIRHFSYTINYATIMIAYFVRYDEHKLAGLIDAPKN